MIASIISLLVCRKINGESGRVYLFLDIIGGMLWPGNRRNVNILWYAWKN